MNRAAKISRCFLPRFVGRSVCRRPERLAVNTNRNPGQWDIGGNRSSHRQFTLIQPQRWEATMRVSEIMTREVRVASPNQTSQEAAAIMAEIDAGAVPVRDNDRLVGMITDRDIAIRAIAKGKGADTSVRDIMTADVRYCFDDEDT